MSIAAFLAPHLWQSARNGPLYVQLFQRLRDAVVQGLLPPGSTLPPEREIAQLTALSRVTVRRAVQMLARNGRNRGRGHSWPMFRPSWSNRCRA